MIVVDTDVELTQMAKNEISAVIYELNELDLSLNEEDFYAFTMEHVRVLPHVKPHSMVIVESFCKDAIKNIYLTKVLYAKLNNATPNAKSRTKRIHSTDSTATNSTVTSNTNIHVTDTKNSWGKTFIRSLFIKK